MCSNSLVSHLAQLLQIYESLLQPYVPPYTLLHPEGKWTEVLSLYIDGGNLVVDLTSLFWKGVQKKFWKKCQVPYNGQGQAKKRGDLPWVEAM